MNRLGLSVSTTSVSNTKAKFERKQQKHIHSLLVQEKLYLEHKSEEVGFSSDIIGDNLDLNRSPAKMSTERKRKSWHWFLMIGLKRRILNPLLDDETPICEITELENSRFIPSIEDCTSVEENFLFHIMKVMVKHIDCLKKYEDCVPKHLPHPHTEESSKVSDYAILDLLDKSENKSEDMISILETIHERFIPQTDNLSVIKNKVFGGDVLTNERAYTAQLAMLNGETESERLTGVIHRPEGLHRMMNLLLVFNGMMLNKFMSSVLCFVKGMCILLFKFY